MSEEPDYNDEPILRPDQDRMGVDPFAQTIAQSIRTMKAPEGSVIAINGTWGSGKSSAINLITHHINDSHEKENIDVLRFSCWWFRGEEALAFAFFNELANVLGGSIDEANEILSEIRNRMVQSAPLIRVLLDSIAPGSGTFAKGFADTLQRSGSSGETIEQLHRRLREALAASRKRIVVIIDDIDRLSPEEALQMFRLIKSVGHLPNVIYLLAYDRELAERVVQERFPSEGPHYLEKIVQAVFELPEPRIPDLRTLLLKNVANICEPELSEEEEVHFHNLCHEVVYPEIRTPRDVVRLNNAISITWPAVAGEVNLGDFLAIETLRVFQPGLYRTVRKNKERLCELPDLGRPRDRDHEAGEADRILLHCVNEVERDHYRNALRRLFPAMETVWGNMAYGHEWPRIWARWRRVGSKRHFDTYFRFSVADDTLSLALVKEVIANADDEHFVQQRFREAVATKRRDGTTNAALLLEELDLHAEDFTDEKIEPFLTCLFSLVDELNVSDDRPRGVLSLADNRLRIHWLIRGLTLERFSLDERSRIFRNACQDAALGWLVDFARSAYNDHFPRSQDLEQISQDRWLVNRSTLDEVLQITLSRLRASAGDGSLQEHPDLAAAIFAWRDFTNDDGREIQEVTAKIMEQDQGVVCLARAFTTDVWMHASGDMVDRRKKRANIGNLTDVVDTTEFRRRLEEIENRSELPNEDRLVISDFLSDWRRQDEGNDSF